MKLSEILNKTLDEQIPQTFQQTRQQIQQPSTPQTGQKEYQSSKRTESIRPATDRWDIKVTPKKLTIYSDSKNKVIGRFKALGATRNTKNGIRNPYDENYYIYNINPDTMAKTLGYKLNQTSLDYLISALNATSPSKKKFIDPDEPDVSLEMTQNPENPNEYTFRKAQAVTDDEVETKDTVYGV